MTLGMGVLVRSGTSINLVCSQQEVWKILGVTSVCMSVCHRLVDHVRPLQEVLVSGRQIATKELSDMTRRVWG